MSETQAVITTLKQALRARNLTYADVARGLAMSEANVKRMFAAERMTLDRIEAICGLLRMELADLFQLYEEGRQRITQLTEDQERELVADTKLLLVAVCVRNHSDFEEILLHHHLSEADVIQCLAKLDRLKIIDLLPGNRIKLRIDENFSWITNGPIENFYEKAIQGEFLSRGFAPHQRQFVFGMLSESSEAIIHNRLQALSNEFIRLHRQDRELPLANRRSVGLLTAIRHWEFSILSPYKK